MFRYLFKFWSKSIRIMVLRSKCVKILVRSSIICENIGLKVKLGLQVKNVQFWSKKKVKKLVFQIKILQLEAKNNNYPAYNRRNNDFLTKIPTFDAGSEPFLLKWVGTFRLLLFAKSATKEVANHLLFCYSSATVRPPRSVGVISRLIIARLSTRTGVLFYPQQNKIK